jgi:hypothetical protein
VPAAIESFLAPLIYLYHVIVSVLATLQKTARYTGKAVIGIRALSEALAVYDAVSKRKLIARYCTAIRNALTIVTDSLPTSPVPEPARSR